MICVLRWILICLMGLPGHFSYKLEDRLGEKTRVCAKTTLKMYRGDVVVQVLDGKGPPVQPPDGLVAGVDRCHTTEMKCCLGAAFHERHQALALHIKSRKIKLGNSEFCFFGGGIHKFIHSRRRGHLRASRWTRDPCSRCARWRTP